MALVLIFGKLSLYNVIAFFFIGLIFPDQAMTGTKQPTREHELKKLQSFESNTAEWTIVSKPNLSGSVTNVVSGNVTSIHVYRDPPTHHLKLVSAHSVILSFLGLCIIYKRNELL